MHNPLAVANWFIAEAKRQGRSCSQMQLHKLVFFAHAVSLARGSGPLIRGEFVAMEYGPVHTELFDFTKGYGPNPIHNFIHVPNFPFITTLVIPWLETNSPAIDVCRQTWRNIGHLDNVGLCEFAFAPGAPWELAFDCGVNSRIPNESIASFYSANNLFPLP